jgi:predicted TIM-barrel fold metal-dependent hydrolase
MWDMSAFVGPWPFRHLPGSEPEALESRLRREGITHAFVSPLEGLFHVDPQPANRVWMQRLQASPFFRFVPVINPTLPGWERALNQCREEGAAAVRLYPNYHSYSPQDNAAQALLGAAAERGLPVLVQLRMQDVRSMHPLAQVPDVNWRETLALGQAHPQATLVVVGASWSEGLQLLEAAKDLPRLSLVLSHLEIVDALPRLVERFGTQRLMMGTHAPLFTPTSARLKVENPRLSAAERAAIVQGNAERLWAN